MWKVRWEHGLSERAVGEVGGEGGPRLNNSWSNDIEGDLVPVSNAKTTPTVTYSDRDALVQTRQSGDGEDSYGDAGRGEFGGDRYGMMVHDSDADGGGEDGRRKRSRSKDRERNREKRRRSRSPRDESDRDREIIDAKEEQESERQEG
jgi:hypothetical protein